MSRSVTDLEDPRPLQHWDNFQDPVFPAIERNRRRYEIIGKSKLVVKQFEKQPQERFHKKQGLGLSQTLVRCVGLRGGFAFGLFRPANSLDRALSAFANIIIDRLAAFTQLSGKFVGAGSGFSG